jgi:hypothetical protein
MLTHDRILQRAYMRLDRLWMYSAECRVNLRANFNTGDAVLREQFRQNMASCAVHAIHGEFVTGFRYAWQVREGSNGGDVIWKKISPLNCGRIRCIG